MTCTEEYREHIEYTFHAFCKVVIRNATINAARTRSRKHKREISLEYLTDEKHYPLGTTDEYFQAPEPDEEYILTLCGDTVIFSSGLLAEALSRLDEREREMIYLSFFKRIPQHEIIGSPPMKHSSKPPAGSRKRWELYCSITAAAYNVPPV